MKFSEKEIQNQIWADKDKWNELILALELENETSYTEEHEIYSLSADKILFDLTLKKIRELYNSVKNLELFGIEVQLEKNNDSAIRADFLGMEPGAPGIAIIELKKSKQTEREAFTELLAYSSHINTIFPTHCTDDNILILIAPMKVRTVREAYLQTLVFDRKRIFALEPVFENQGDITSLKLKPFIPKQEDLVAISEVAFAKRNFDVEVVVWQDTPDFWNATKEERNPSASQKENMNRVSAYAAQLMEANKIHGFVYTQQSWPELTDLLPLSNSLVLVGFNPYKIANDQIYKTKFPDMKISEIPEIGDSGPNLGDLIKGLNKCCKDLHQEENYMVWLNMVWGSHLGRIGSEVVKNLNLNRYSGDIWTERGSMTWADYEANFLENIATFNFDIRPTGILRELFWETTKIDYQYWSKNDDHPIQGDIYGWAVETLTSHNFFSEFLERMFGDPFGIRDIDETTDEEN